MLPRNRAPTHPGEILAEEFLVPGRVTQGAFAERLGVNVHAVNSLVNGKRRLTATMALRLSDALGTTPEFWMNLQNAWDLWHARRELSRRLA